MVPVIAAGGRSFKGAFSYYCHDKNADTTDRIAWTQTRNMLTQDPAKAWKVMAFTAKHQDQLKQAAGIAATGRKTTKPVLAYSLSWHPSQDPDREHMTEMAMKSIKALGLEEHEALIVAHRDTPHKHVHVVVNRIHPLTGKVASDSHSKRVLSALALEYSKQHDLDICPAREDNAKKREQGEQTKYRNPHIQNAWDISDNGKRFVAALKENGFHLAMGRKRIVVVDPYGKTLNPVRHIEGIRTKDLKERLKDIDTSKLPDADELATRITEARKQTAVAKPAQTPTTPNIEKDFTLASTPKPPSEAQHYDLKQTPKEQEQERTAHLINQTQDRHIQERAKLGNHWHWKIENEKKHLSNFYQIKRQMNAIWHLQQRCENHNFWHRITGRARDDREQLKALQLNLKNARMRFDEKIDHLEKQRDIAFYTLDKQQNMQRPTGAYRMDTPHMARSKSTGFGYTHDFTPTRSRGMRM